MSSNDGWATYNSLSYNDENFNSLLNERVKRNIPLLARKTGLSKLRAYGEFDFAVVCNDGTIPVHSLILSSQWPFFKAMRESHMEESQTRKLKLDFPVLWIEALIAYLYEELRPLEFEVAVGLLDVARMYHLPDILCEAMERIKSENMNFD